MSALYGRAPAIRSSCRGKGRAGYFHSALFSGAPGYPGRELAEFRIKDLALNRKYSVIYHKNKFLPAAPGH